MYTVFIKPDESGCVVAINSDAHLTRTEGWREIDHGNGYRYRHAQANYLPEPLLDNDDCYRWMTAPASVEPERDAYILYEYDNVEWGIYRRTQAEMGADKPEEVLPSPTLESRVETLESQNKELVETVEMILSGVVEDE